MLVDSNILAFFSAATVVVHGLGIAHAAHAVMNVRSSRGAIAWSISLVTFPWLAIPLYWILGRTKFHGYTEALRSVYGEHYQRIQGTYGEITKYQVAVSAKLLPLQLLAQTLTGIPFTSGNNAELLINGQQTYAAMLEAIASAKSYILLQSYIIVDDQVGSQFKQALITKAREGVRIYLLYDEIGSSKLTHSYIKSLQKNDIQVSAFHTTRGRGNRFQLNFRNHRKILVVDGEIAFIGGLNIGDEYLGKNRRLSPWRDTHVMLQGAIVQSLQTTFLQDWYWATRQIIDVHWQVEPNQETDFSALILPTGPADKFKTCKLFFVNTINQAQSRIWIASPYFVPDDSTLTALKLAALRGVEVKIILPNRPDHLLVYLCSFSYYSEMETMKIKLYRYKHGFMHQKIILIDNELAGVGTVNLDNRSFFLNFEVMGFIANTQFAKNVEQMLTDDLEASVIVDYSEYDQKSLWFRLAVRVSRLLTPLL